jgi:hypothetical protein
MTNWPLFCSPATAVQASEAASAASGGSDRVVLVEQVPARPLPVLHLRHHRTHRASGNRPKFVRDWFFAIGFSHAFSIAPIRHSRFTIGIFKHLFFLKCTYAMRMLVKF